ncbi:MAG: hypothetical protein WA996_11365 [Candidatus Promineifilaceae bacterium]
MPDSSSIGGQVMVIFEVGEEYANRKGSYTVLEISDPKMTVEYEDGSTADLSISIQQRIWENIVTEREAERARTVKARKTRVSVGTRFYIKPTSVLTVEELSTTNKQEGIPASGRWLATIRKGDRLIYYAQESQVFFAVVTITGPGNKLKGKGRKKTSVLYFPLDVDAYVVDLNKALLAVSVELESQPKYKEILADSDDYLEITEDEFELLAEMLTEVSEEDEEDEEDQEKDDEEFDA